MQPDTRTEAESSGQAFLKRLRADTAASHTALEAHPLSQAISGPAVVKEDYIRYLQVMQRVVAGAETVLFPVLDSIIPDLEQRRKHPVLAIDLRDLRTADNPFPPFCLFEGTPSAASALGAFYVLEGSTLGGRVILKRLSPDLGVSPQHGARYFAGYGDDTGRFWQRFLQLLSSGAEGPHSAEDMIEGARHAFLRITDYFNLCQAYESAGHRQP